MKRERAAVWLAAAGLFLAACFAAVPARGSNPERLELRGVVVRPDGSPFHDRQVVAVALHGARSPFHTHTLPLGGKFKFTRLEPGSYTMIINAVGFPEVRQTIEVTPGLATKKGRVEIKITLQEGEGRRRLGTVSVRQLSVPEGAVEDYRRALRDLGDPQHRKTDDAIAHLLRAIERAPQYVEALNLLGTIYYQTRQLDKAEDVFRRALAADGNAYEPLVNLGGTLLDLDRFDEALPLNRMAALARPTDPLAHAQFGLNLFALGDYTSAVVALNRAKRLDPSHFSHPQLVLAEIFMRQGKKAEAVKELEEFARLHPDEPITARIRKSLPELLDKIQEERRK